MTKTLWTGVHPALMTEFRADESLDLEATARHIDAMLSAGCDGVIMLGTLGENVSLTADEKRRVIAMAVETVGDRGTVVAGCAEYTTGLAADYIRDAARAGADGAMLLPPMVYKTAPEETIVHFRSVAQTSDIPIMVYNNPIGYGTDVTPEMFADLAETPALEAIKESSADVRRLTDLFNLTGDRYALCCGVDDIVLEAVMLGAVGWVAGLVNAFPEESVRLFNLARDGRYDEARALYRWFMPLLRLDTLPKLVQYIKLANAMTGHGSEHVRRPRLPLAGDERARIEAIIREAMESRPRMAAE